MRAPVKAKTKQKAAAVAAPVPTRSLVSRQLDFWLLGGVSLVVWAVMFAIDPSGKNPFSGLLGVASVLALFITSPHFIASYLFAYRKGWAFLRAHWFQLLLVPAVLLGLIAFAWFLRESPSASSPMVASINRGFEAMGLRTRVGLTHSLSTEVMSLLVHVMFLTVGWHYTKQVYGCMMVYGHYDGVTLNEGQRRLLKLNLFLLWWLTFSWVNSSTTSSVFFGLEYFHLGLPPVIFVVTLGLFALSLLAVVVRVFWPLFRAKQKPGLNFLVPFVAMFVWWFPALKQREYYLYLVPVFHSLQYLAFVFKLEGARTRDLAPASVKPRVVATVIGLLLVSYLSFDFLPNSADELTQSRAALGLGFFLVCAQVFINVHHYFIDNVLWRFQNPEIRKYLLS